MTRRRPPPASFARATGIALASAAALASCAHAPVHRYFQPSPDQIGPYANSFGEAVIPKGGLIVVQGDDFAYGLARGRSRHMINGADEGQAAITISQALRHVLKGVKIENRGFPGDTAAQSAARWADAPPADLTILSFSYGDAAVQTPIPEFAQAAAAMIAAAQAHGGTVFVALPPPSSDPLRNSIEAGYRETLRAVAKSAGAEVFDATAVMVRLRMTAGKTIAQRAVIYQGVAADMVPYIKIIDAPPSAPPPQAGQDGSGESRTVRDSAASPS